MYIYLAQLLSDPRANSNPERSMNKDSQYQNVLQYSHVDDFFFLQTRFQVLQYVHIASLSLSTSNDLKTNYNENFLNLETSNYKNIIQEVDHPRIACSRLKKPKNTKLQYTWALIFIYIYKEHFMHANVFTKKGKLYPFFSSETSILIS